MLYEELNKTMKEAGDVVNYAKYVAEEMKQMSQQLANRVQEATLLNSSQENLLKTSNNTVLQE
jgi:hypothetical protein